MTAATITNQISGGIPADNHQSARITTGAKRLLGLILTSPITMVIGFGLFWVLSLSVLGTAIFLIVLLLNSSGFMLVISAAVIVPVIIVVCFLLMGGLAYLLRRLEEYRLSRLPPDEIKKLGRHELAGDLHRHLKNMTDKEKIPILALIEDLECPDRLDLDIITRHVETFMQLFPRIDSAKKYVDSVDSHGQLQKRHEIAQFLRNELKKCPNLPSKSEVEALEKDLSNFSITDAEIARRHGRTFWAVMTGIGAGYPSMIRGFIENLPPAEQEIVMGYDPIFDE